MFVLSHSHTHADNLFSDHQYWTAVFHSMHCFVSKHLLIAPTKCTVYILYIPLWYFWYMFQCHVYHHQGELLCHLLKTIYCYKAVKYGFCGSYAVNILWKVQLCVRCSYSSCTVVKNHRCGTTVLFVKKTLIICD